MCNNDLDQRAIQKKVPAHCPNQCAQPSLPPPLLSQQTNYITFIKRMETDLFPQQTHQTIFLFSAENDKLLDETWKRKEQTRRTLQLTLRRSWNRSAKRRAFLGSEGCWDDPWWPSFVAPHLMPSRTCGSWRDGKHRMFVVGVRLFSFFSSLLERLFPPIRTSFYDESKILILRTT